jgi:hypothetical protein
MTGDEFWQRVASLGGRVAEAEFDRLTAALAAGPMVEVLGFADRLDEALRRLDLLALAAQHVWDTEDDLLDDPPPLDRDGFLDARAAVICAGQDIYERVLADPAAFGGIWDFSAEMLLYVPVEAYEAKTGKPWPYVLPGTDETLAEIEAHRADRPDGHGPDVAAELAAATEVVDAAELADTAELADGPESEPDPGGAWTPPVQADGGAVRLDVRRHAFWLVEVAGSHDLEPVEGFLADPAPAFGIPPGSEATEEWPEACVAEAFPAASARITEVLRAHGGLAPLPLRRMSVVLMLSGGWDLTLRLRPYSGAVHVASDAAASWSAEDAVRAVTGIAAHVMLEAIQDYRVDHPAAGHLVRLRYAAADLVPFSAGSPRPHFLD